MRNECVIPDTIMLAWKNAGMPTDLLANIRRFSSDATFRQQMTFRAIWGFLCESVNTTLPEASIHYLIQRATQINMLCSDLPTLFGGVGWQCVFLGISPAISLFNDWTDGKFIAFPRNPPLHDVIKVYSVKDFGVLLRTDLYIVNEEYLRELKKSSH